MIIKLYVPLRRQEKANYLDKMEKRVIDQLHAWLLGGISSSLVQK
jgi:hypothetical protein